MTLNEVIQALVNIRAEHGGHLPVESVSTITVNEYYGEDGEFTHKEKGTTETEEVAEVICLIPWRNPQSKRKVVLR